MKKILPTILAFALIGTVSAQTATINGQSVVPPNDTLIDRSCGHIICALREARVSYMTRDMKTFMLLGRRSIPQFCEVVWNLNMVNEISFQLANAPSERQSCITY